MSDDRAERIRQIRSRVRAGDSATDADRSTDSASDSEPDKTVTETESSAPGGVPAGARKTEPSSAGRVPGAVTSNETAESGVTAKTVGRSDTAGSDGNDHVDGPRIPSAIAEAGSVGEKPTVDPEAMTTSGVNANESAIADDSGVFVEGNTLIPSAHHDDETVQVLEFFLNEDRYAITIDRISAIVEMRETTRFPRGPEAIDGITDLRGEITAVLDPTTLLDVERSTPSASHYIIVLKRDDDKQKLGLRVTDVSQAVTYHEHQIEDTGTVSSADSAHNHEFLRGIIRKSTDEGEALVAWLDVDEIVENIR